MRGTKKGWTIKTHFNVAKASPMLLLQSGTYWFMAQTTAAASIPRNTQHARLDRCKEENKNTALLPSVE